MIPTATKGGNFTAQMLHFLYGRINFRCIQVFACFYNLSYESKLFSLVIDSLFLEHFSKNTSFEFGTPLIVG